LRHYNTVKGKQVFDLVGSDGLLAGSAGVVVRPVVGVAGNLRVDGLPVIAA
jgi:hypothetical protein